MFTKLHCNNIQRIASNTFEITSYNNADNTYSYAYIFTAGAKSSIIFDNRGRARSSWSRTRDGREKDVYKNYPRAICPTAVPVRPVLRKRGRIVIRLTCPRQPISARTHTHMGTRCMNAMVALGVHSPLMHPKHREDIRSRKHKE